ncbi:TetR family transcriptional regulator [Cohnella lupini]|uniref:TetR family transcriptional regulator n=2 Tax=Cohnella lupini TaxID=1294267 RepID=A0A3D9IVQ8_9BACL|nr:TetR family transcriptional regulator [Cohnella lupini]
MRDKVLMAASAMFMEFGYEPVTINAIAERAGVTKASVYYYFTNKAVLFAKSVSAMMRRISSSTRKILEANSGIRDKLEQLAFTKMSRPHLEFESLLREAIPFLSAEQLDDIRKAEHSIHEVIAKTFQEAMDAGEIARANSLLLSHAFTALLMIGTREQVGEVHYSGRELSDAIVALFWKGISPD